MAGRGEPLLVVDSLARPGRNITGLSGLQPELETKRLERLTEMAPASSGRASIFRSLDLRAAYAAQCADRETLCCCSVCRRSDNQFQHGSASSRYSIVNVKPSICRSGNSSRTNCFGTWLAAHGGLPSAAKV